MSIPIELREPVSFHTYRPITLRWVVEKESYWVFMEEPKDSKVVLDVPKDAAASIKRAHAVAQLMCNHITWAHDAGVKRGREQAQRHFQLALGLAEPTFEERALWNNAVPLRKEGGK